MCAAVERKRRLINLCLTRSMISTVALGLLNSIITTAFHLVVLSVSDAGKAAFHYSTG
ncbi:hypothetical protein BJV78DRAFT_1233291 [Lactifluus subvellereus]|nr:hypothetical protein BJV78DRAFT_1233291 [Lactifluus subvellereus]